MPIIVIISGTRTVTVIIDGSLLLQHKYIGTPRKDTPTRTPQRGHPLHQGQSWSTDPSKRTPPTSRTILVH